MGSTNLSVTYRRSPRRIPYPLRPLAAAFALAQIAGTALAASGVTHVVTTCDDVPVLPICNGIDDGTLRQALGCAVDGDVVDLTQLQCSKVTLGAPLIVGTIGLEIRGPGPERLVIDAHNAFRALVHNGRSTDTLVISGVSIQSGHYENPYTYGGGGGCIFSSGSVSLTNSRVEGCITNAASTVATGGAIFAKGTVGLAYSSVAYNVADGGLKKKYSVARGGGIYADTVNLLASRVAFNVATSSTDSPTRGGGVHANHFVGSYSTIDFNLATTGGGIVAPSSFVLADSTVSYNSADYLGGVATFTADPANVYSSTIAANHASAKDSIGGISGTTLHLESTIVADNYSADARADVGAVNDGISGANNLIRASNAPVPPDTLNVDPMLGPLLYNGGPTPTHALSWGSPAIDHGNNAFNSDEDQLLSPRVRGSAADIGAAEFDGVFHSGFD